MAVRRNASELGAEPLHMQTLLAALAEEVVELDERREVVYVNPAGLAILGRAEDEVLGGPGAHLLGAAGVEPLERGLRDAQEQGDSHVVRLEVMYGMRTIGVALIAMPRLEGPMGILVVLREVLDNTCRLSPTAEDREVFRL